MANLLFNHDRCSYEVKVRREGELTIAEVFNADGTSTNKVDATNEMLSDLKGEGHDDLLRRLQKKARDAFISRT